MKARFSLLPLLLLLWQTSVTLADEAEAAPAAAGNSQWKHILLIIAAVAIGFWLIKIIARFAADLLARQVNLGHHAPPAGRAKLAETDDFAKFSKEFQAPAPATTPAPTATSPTATPTTAASQDARPTLTEQIHAAQKLMEKSSWAESKVTQHDILSEVHRQLLDIKNLTSPPELRPAWQLATALEGLLKQLTTQMNNVTDSTLRTATSGLELLAGLNTPGLRPDLALNPPIKILVVDDDQISRFALCSALKKVFGEPAIAETGEEALVLTRNGHFDLIILDVMMSGMDGFEVCAKIRETPLNSNSPVLFVTALKDIASRTKSFTSGGNDLISKPFLSFEIIVKALTLTLRTRLHEANPANQIPAGHTEKPAVSWPTTTPQPAAEPAPIAAPAPAADAPLITPPPPVYTHTTPRQLNPAFTAYLKQNFTDLITQTKTFNQTADSAARREKIVQNYLRTQFLAHTIDLPELKPAAKLCSALEGLFKKFKENPANATNPAIRTAVDALELADELCAPDTPADLAENPAIRILVVDDEPIARRAITGALQMAFYKPAGVDAGETALELAAEKEFDVVFLDVMMAGMDGFEVCTRIHESPANRFTPVVFVTSLSDEKFRAQAKAAGGRDYVVKPFVFMEINLKALTFALRGRLEKIWRAKSGYIVAPANFDTGFQTKTK